MGVILYHLQYQRPGDRPTKYTLEYPFELASGNDHDHRRVPRGVEAAVTNTSEMQSFDRHFGMIVSAAGLLFHQP
jgi:hypothetical protein